MDATADPSCKDGTTQHSMDTREPTHNRSVAGSRPASPTKLLERYDRGRGRLPLGRASDARGWVIDSPRLLGVKHFRHLSPQPAGYRYLYPDFFQVVYGAQAHRFDPGGRERDGYELGAEFQPTAQVQRQPLYPSERLFLAAALAGVSSS